MGEGPSIALGPIAVHPDHQGQGIGSALVAAVLVTADLGGEPSVVLLGDPGWYAHFGFQTAADHGIGSPGPWADRFFQVRPLQAWHPELAGAFRYAPAFDLDIEQAQEA
jgi:putative acetyltransferase